MLLLQGLLVLLQRQDERLVLKCHSRTGLGSSDTKQTFSPVLKLSSVLIRSVATGEPAPIPSRAREGQGGARAEGGVLSVAPPSSASLRRQARPVHHLHLGAGTADLRASRLELPGEEHVGRRGASWEGVIGATPREGGWQEEEQALGSFGGDSTPTWPVLTGWLGTPQSLQGCSGRTKAAPPFEGGAPEKVSWACLAGGWTS